LALSDVSAMCSTLDPYNGTNCDDHQVCTLPSGCNCTRVDVSRPIANGEECLVNNYIASIGDFDITPHALSGSVVNYKMTIVNRQ
jgi:hypothetical protein